MISFREQSMALESREILLIKFNIYTDYIFRKLIHVASPLIINNDTLRLRYTYISQYRKFNEITHFQSKFSNSRSPKISSRLNIFETTLHLHPIPHSLQSSANQLSKKGRKNKQKRKLLHGYFANRFTGRKNNSRSRDSPPSFTRRTRCTVSYINVPQEGGRTSRQRADAPRN